jgi:NADH-quinone oxidoreductase subunit F
MGAEVTVIYRRQRKDMPAIAEEVDAAEAEGVKYIFLAAPKRILASENGRVKAIEVNMTQPGEFDSSGRRIPVATEETNRYHCDMVIQAIGERVEAEPLSQTVLALNEDGTIKVDRFTMQTNSEHVYAGGDVVTGASNVSNAMASGKRAAEMLDERLMNANRFTQIDRSFEFGNQVPLEPQGGRRNTSREIAADERVKSFREVFLGFTKSQAHDEANRCLRCDVKECDRVFAGAAAQE